MSNIDLSQLVTAEAKAASDMLEAMETIPADFTDNQHWP